MATFPSSLRLAAAVELILMDLKVPENIPEHRSLSSLIFQAFTFAQWDWKWANNPFPFPPLRQRIVNYPPYPKRNNLIICRMAEDSRLFLSNQNYSSTPKSCHDDRRSTDSCPDCSPEKQASWQCNLVPRERGCVTVRRFEVEKKRLWSFICGKKFQVRILSVRFVYMYNQLLHPF